MILIISFLFHRLLLDVHFMLNLAFSFFSIKNLIDGSSEQLIIKSLYLSKSIVFIQEK